MKHGYKGALGVLAIAALSAAHATEGGGSTYPMGVENFLTGAAPPPGFYVMEYINLYSANKLKDNNGDTIPLPTFSVKATAAATRFVWSTPYQMLGGNLVFHAIVPLVDLKVEVPGLSQRKSGLGDTTLGIGIAMHHSQNLHSVIDIDLVAPTGRYDKADLANIGRNYWSIQPLYTMSYIDPQGLNGDFKATFNLNRKNDDTGYKSGNEFILDYSAGWGVGGGFTLGVGGHWYRQLSDDTLNGASVPNSRASSFAMGPSLKYDNGKGWFITAKWQKESSVRNRPAGSALWIKTSIPF
jgi:hypothetical protein